MTLAQRQRFEERVTAAAERQANRPKHKAPGYPFRTLSVEEQRVRDEVICTLLLDGHGHACVGRGFNLSRQRVAQMARRLLGWNRSGIGLGRCCPHPIHHYPMGPEGQP